MHGVSKNRAKNGDEEKSVQMHYKGLTCSGRRSVCIAVAVARGNLSNVGRLSSQPAGNHW